MGGITMRNIEHLKRILKEHKVILKRQFKVKEIGFFCSYVRGGQKRNSDLDVLVEFSRVPGFFKFIEMENYLGKILKVKVDLVMKSALKPRIGRFILDEVIYL